MKPYEVIDAMSWDQAEWHAVLLGVDRLAEEPPVLGLVFRRPVVARRIFASWRERFGESDGFDVVRVSIVEGDKPMHPEGFVVSIGANIDGIAKWAAHNEVRVPRMVLSGIRSYHSTSPGLDMFKEALSTIGEFRLAPVYPEPDGDVDIDFEMALRKRQVVFKLASEVAEDEPEVAALPPFQLHQWRN